MNTKTKLMLGLSALTAGTLAAGATGTFAWFTTNKTATATYNNIKAQAKTGNLQIKIDKVTDSNATITPDGEGKFDYTATANGAASCTADVSSKDGINFYQPNWVGTAGNSGETKINGVTDVSKKDGYFTQYQITLKNTATKTGENNAAVKVKLTGLTITGTDGSKLTGWTRVAVNVGATIDEDRLVAATDKAAKAALYQTDIKGYNRVVKAPGNTVYATMKEALDTVTGIKEAKSTLDAALEITSSLASEGTIAVGVSVWMEGTMADAQDEAKGQVVSVAMTFQTEDVD